MRPWAVCLFVLANTALAEDGAWRASWDAAWYAEATARQIRRDGPLNPDNHVALLAEDSQGAELRANLKLEHDSLRLTLRPILSWRRAEGGEDAAVTRSGYLSQGQARLGLTDTLAASLGRELMNWGPAQFRSPSSPFYFDNGRGEPTRELSGVDAVKLAWTPDAARSLSLAYVEDSGHDTEADDPWRRTWLAKGEWRGDDWTAGLAVARARGHRPFVGAYGQWTLDEAWLIYAEAASSRRAQALASPADMAQPFTLLDESPRRTTALFGAMHSFENGQSLSLELLRDGHGYTSAEAAAYFARAAADPVAAGLALSRMPALLGRHYAHLVWQNNLLGDGTYWRLMLSRDLDDGGSQLAAYLDHPLNDHVSFYALGVANGGGARREFSTLIERGLSVGLRLALP